MSTPPTSGSTEFPAAKATTTGEVAVTAPQQSNVVSRFRRLLPNDLGQVPVYIGFILIALYLQIAGGGLYITPGNISNLINQIVGIVMVALAAVLVLLIGEIDLSLTAVASLGGAIMAVLSVRHGWPFWSAILAGLLAGLVIGVFNGLLVAVLRMPSFIVTLAGFIGYQGVLSIILQPQTTLQVLDPVIIGIALYNVPTLWGIGLPVVAIALYGLNLFLDRASRLRAKLPVKTVGQIVLQIVILAVIVGVFVTLLELAGGVPLVALIMAGFLVLFWLITQRTAFGRHLYAVGGNAEAARRAGINVVGLRVAVFALASMLAVVGGILLVSRGTIAAAEVSPRLLLDSIAAAVIGGVSLFGGRGSVWAVVIGALIVGTLYNGLNLLGIKSNAIQELLEAAVLLLAVLSDSIARRRGASGLR